MILGLYLAKIAKKILIIWEDFEDIFGWVLQVEKGAMWAS